MFKPPYALFPEKNYKGQRILKAFLAGSKGKQLRLNKQKKYSGDIAIYGLKKPWLFKSVENFWYIDNGYFLPSRPPRLMKGYYRIIRNSWYSDGKGPESSKRLKNFGVKLEKWKAGGSHIILVPPTKWAAPVIGERSPEAWVSKTKKTLCQYTDRPIHVSTKKNPLDWTMSIHCIVCCMSNVQVESLIKGIPVITTRFTNIGSLEQIENPPGEESREILESLAAQQWNMKEIQNGKAWSDLNIYPN